MFPGFGTLLNVATVLIGSGLGLLIGHRLPHRTRDVVTDSLGLVTLLIAATSAAMVIDADFAAAVGSSATVLVVLGALLVGGITGSLLHVEDRLEGLGARIQRRLTRAVDHGDGTGGERRRRFVEGFVTASLVFCIGPLTILGSLSDGMGEGVDQLVLKSTLDGFASIAFAASFGWGVMASALAVAVVQGSITIIGVVVGDLVSDAQVAALTATGGLLLVGVALRLLRMKQLAVGDLLPALVFAPIIVSIVSAFRT